VYDIKHCKIAYQAKGNACTGSPAYLVGGFPDYGDRRGWCGLCCIKASSIHYAYPLDTGPLVPKRVWQPLFVGISPQNSDPDRCQPSCRCPMGDGGRAAVQSPVLCHWRDLGRPICANVHVNQTARVARRGQQNPMLAHPARGSSEPQCGTRSVAHYSFAVGATPKRFTGTRRASMAGRIVPVTSPTTRHMGGNL
jgi:hypothetical protein